MAVGADLVPVLTKSMTWQVSMLIVLSGLALAVFGYAIWRWRQSGRSEMFWIALGAMAAVFYEPLGDSLVNLVYHQTGTLTALRAFGRTIPLWVLPCYAVFFGPAILWLVKYLQTAPTRARWMGLYGACIPATWVFEVLLLKMGAYVYFGAHQPVKILGYPVWMAFSNSAVIFLTSAMVFLCMRSQAVLRAPAVLAFMVPCLIIGIGVVTLIPIGFAMSATYSVLAINVGAALSALLSIALVWVSYSLTSEEGSLLAVSKTVDRVTT
ncbi:hypothetical protein [Mycobacterium sp.]|uniref:hypothetical protein n=1 Tax=Mycobacterium sp. TaxID=1785 RepID=UPI003F9B763C